MVVGWSRLEIVVAASVPREVECQTSLL
jgi:hypothetical protein